MNRAEVLDRLKSLEPRLRAHGVSALYLFGSYGRDQANASSDIDVFVDDGGDHFYDLSNFMGAFKGRFPVPISVNRPETALEVRAAERRERSDPHILMAPSKTRSYARNTSATRFRT